MSQTREAAQMARQEVDVKVATFRQSIQNWHPQQILNVSRAMDEAILDERTDIGRYGLIRQQEILSEVYRAKTGRSLCLDS